MVESEKPRMTVWSGPSAPAGPQFHDGEPVRSKDVVASLTRWSARDPMGLMLKALQNELVAVDDRTFKWSLKAPYPKMLLALARTARPAPSSCRTASLRPTRSSRFEYIGSAR